MPGTWRWGSRALQRQQSGKQNAQQHGDHRIFRSAWPQLYHSFTWAHNRIATAALHFRTLHLIHYTVSTVIIRPTWYFIEINTDYESTRTLWSLWYDLVFDAGRFKLSVGGHWGYVITMECEVIKQAILSLNYSLSLPVIISKHCRLKSNYKLINVFPSHFRYPPM